MSRRHRTRTVALVCLAAAATPAVTARDMVAASGDFYSEVVRLKNLAFGADTGLYVPPSASQFDSFKALAGTLLTGNYALADSQAAALNYDLVSFTDTATSRSYYELREQLAGGQQQTGWGTFVLNPAGATSALVEVPHVLFDSYTENVGAKAFQLANAQFFLMAGAQRNANGAGTADVAHLAGSIFEAVHEAWNGASGQTTAWQVHGFDESAESFPADTAAVLADGSGSVTSKMITLDKQLAAHGLTAYAYNTLPASDPGNKLVNTSSAGVVYPGPTFSDLGATTNVQGAYSRAHGGTFVHAELSQAVRFSPPSRNVAATALALAMQDSNLNVKLWDGDAGGGSWTANNSTGQNWSPDGIPDASSAILFDNSLVATLPSSMNLIRTTATTAVQYMVWNSNDPSELHAATTGSGNSVLAFNGDGVGNTTPLLSMGPLAVDNLLQFKNTNSSTGTGKVVLQLNTSGAFNVTNPGATLQVDSVIQESGGARTLEKTGDGTLVLTAPNTFTGGVVVSAGVLSVTGTTPLGTVPGLSPAFITLNGGTLRYTASTAITSVTNRGMTVTANGGALELTSPTAVITFNGQITGPGTLTKSGPGELVLNSPNNATGTATVAPFAGGVAVTGGTLTIPALANAPAAPDAPAVQFTVDNGATLKWTGTSSVNLSANRQFSLGATGGTLDLAPANFTINGRITGSPAATLTKTGPGTLVLANSNSFGGGVVVNGGVLSISQGTNLGALPDAPAPNHLTLNDATLRVTSGFTLGSTRGILLGGSADTIDVPADSPFSVAGTVSGSASLTKTGPGTLVLDPGNTYTGPTTILAGTLSTAAASSVGTGGAGDPLPLTIANNATLQVTSSYTTARPITVAAGGATVDVTDAAVYTRTAPITAPAGDTLTKTGAGAMVVPNLRTAGPVRVAAGRITVAAADASDAGTSLLPALLIDTAPDGYAGTLDLQSGKLAIDYAGASPVDTLRQYLLAGRDGGSWDGTGLLSSAAAADSSRLTAIAYAEASQLAVTSWGGQPLDGAALVTILAPYGDANLDGQVNADDYALLDRAAARALTSAHWTDGDFNYDGQITPDDYLLIDTTFAASHTLTPALLSQRESQFGPTYVSTLLASVPEPSALSGLLAGLPLLTRRRHSR